MVKVVNLGTCTSWPSALDLELKCLIMVDVVPALQPESSGIAELSGAAQQQGKGKGSKLEKWKKKKKSTNDETYLFMSKA